MFLNKVQEQALFCVFYFYFGGNFETAESFANRQNICTNVK